MEPIILLVENDPFILGLLKKNLNGLGKGIHIILASSLSQGFYAFNQFGKDILCAVLGGQLDSYTTTLPLAKEMNESGFPTTRISFSGDEGDEDLQNKQIVYCTHRFRKSESVKMIEFINSLIPSSKIEGNIC